MVGFVGQDLHSAMNFQTGFCNTSFILFRPAITVLVSGCGKTTLMRVHSDSPGKALYQAVQRRSGIPVALQTLIHGARIIRHSLSLGKQGVGQLSTVFIQLAMGKGGGKTRLGTEGEEEGMGSEVVMDCWCVGGGVMG